MSSNSASILVVCTGNVCRSPYLEYLMQDRLNRVWGQGRFAVASAGVRGLVGERMTEHSAELLSAEGIDSADFRARRVSAEHLNRADLVICATRVHRGAVVQLAPALLRRAVMLPELAFALGHLPQPPVASGDPPELGLEEGRLDRDLSTWLRSVARAVVDRRPMIVGTVAQDDLDIDDPYGGPIEAYDQMKDQIGRWLPEALAALSPGTGVGPTLATKQGPTTTES